MKKKLVMALALSMSLTLAACGSSSDSSSEEADTTVEESSEETEETSSEEEQSSEEENATVDLDAEVPVLTYEEYVAADLDTEVSVCTYVQATQSWWDGTITVYTQDEDGAYFLYNMTCSEEDAELLVPGTKIVVTGYKSEWAGEVEIIDAFFEFAVDGDTYVAEPLDVTDLLADDSLIDYQNQYVSFTGMTVEPSTDANGNEVAFLYNWDGSGEAGSNCDLYFNVSVNGETYTFTVESYLCDESTEVYQAVTELEVGSVIDMEGFLYWYEGVNPHITSVTVVE
ncbi:MAG: hypothetical protein LUI10_04040 [Lachnospiraceae bacterium]|nr:hypothetical protein [Lachnospiraceae bacterium]